MVYATGSGGLSGPAHTTSRTQKGVSVKAALSLLAVAGLTYTMTFGASASKAPPIGRDSLRSAALHTSPLHAVSLASRRVPMQVGGTGTPTTTPVASPTPSPTSNPYPDPVELLGVAIQKLSAVKSIGFTLKQVAEQTNVEKVTINASGVANCKADYIHVSGSDNVTGTSQTKKINYWFEETTKTFYKKQVVNDSTHHKWQKVAAKKTYPFGVSAWSVDNPLPCFVPSGSSSSGSSGSGSGGNALRNLTDLGPASYAGSNTWHLQATDDGQDSQGNPEHLVLDYYVTQSASVLVGFKATLTAPSQNILETAEQQFKNPGKKVTIPSIKTGSTKP